jgi:L-asparaginase II
VEAAGRLIGHAGDPAFYTVLRSAAKPFQALPLLRDGAAARFAITPEELALVCASHNSEPDQVARVRALLDRIGCAETDLACGPHRPLWRDLALRDRIPTRIPDVPATPLASNCSGKHTGMLALARHHGWDVAGYHLAGHPVQQRCHAEIAEWAGLAPGTVGQAVDGCGVVCFGMPLRRMAGALARLATSRDAAARAVVHAMTNHPDLVAGQGRPCTAVMRAFPGAVLAKVGAEGVYGAALLEHGLGLAIKVEDGNGWAAVVALIAMLGTLGLSAPDALSPYAEIPLRNTRGEAVGVIRPAGRLTLN